MNYPNPFNPETWIPFELATPAEVTIEIYNLQGQRVRALRIGFLAAGTYKSQTRAGYWDRRNEVGERASNGIYFLVFRAGNTVATQKLVIRK